MKIQYKCPVCNINTERPIQQLILSPEFISGIFIGFVIGLMFI